MARRNLQPLFRNIMSKIIESKDDIDFFANPKIMDNYPFLQEVGVFDYINALDKEIQNYKNLFASALDIFNRTTISEIMDATVWQISDHILPSFIAFLWKPLQNREDITVKSYKNYKLVDLNLKVESISIFEPFFRKNPEPVKYKIFSSKVDECETIKSFNAIEPELIIPILGLSGLYGLVLVGHKIIENDYSQAELIYIQNLMSFVSKAIQNHLHYERTLRDVKTGLYNNAFFMNRLNEEISRSKRTHSRASIIIIDVDKFKDFNDKYGHIAGDRVLESLAITIKQGVRTEDVPSRFGGEEFTVLLPDTDKDHAWLVAERLRIMVSAMKVTWDPPLPQVTISVGLFTFDKDTDLVADEIIGRADEALYLSKALGRNRTTVWRAGLFDKIGQTKPEENSFEQ